MTAIGRALLILLFLLIPFLRVRPIFPADTFKEVKIEKNNLLEIPILNLSEEIVPANPFNIKEYMPVLNNHVARATETSDKLIYLFAHSDKSKPIFANLNFLAENDTVIFNSKKYYVADKKIVVATDLSPIEQNPPDETLILQTCPPGGSYNKRLIVTAKPVVYLTRNLRPLEN